MVEILLRAYNICVSSASDCIADTPLLDQGILIISYDINAQDFISFLLTLL